MSPLVFWFGHTSAAERVGHLRRVVSVLAAAVGKRLELDAEARTGGLIVNTCGWVDGQGYELLQCVSPYPTSAHMRPRNLVSYVAS